eukprot:scaffold265493_cov46-Attheya_sp.AAC.1
MDERKHMRRYATVTTKTRTRDGASITVGILNIEYDVWMDVYMKLLRDVDRLVSSLGMDSSILSQ